LTTDQSSATNGLQVQFSIDDVNWDSVKAYTVNVPTAGSSYTVQFSENSPCKFYRLVYTNGGTSQGVFRVQVLLNAQTETKTFIQGQMNGNIGSNKQVSVTTDGYLNVNLANPTSAFSDVRVTEPTAVWQFDFVYGLNTNYVITSTASGGTTTSSNQLGICTTTTTSGSSAIIQSKKYFKYRDGQGGLVRFTAIFTAGIANCNQITGVGDTTDGYFFGYNGTSFGILYRKNAVDTWTNQSSWNNDTLLGSDAVSNPSGMKLDQTKGNVYQICFSYLGFGNILFYVYDQRNSVFNRVHTLSFANLNTTPLVTNPAVSLWWQRINTGTAASGGTLSSASGSLFVEGNIQRLGAIYGRTSQKTLTNTTETNLITLRNNTTINSITNKSSIILSKISFGAVDNSTLNNNNTVKLDIILNTTLGGTPSYTNVDTTNSIAAFDVAGTTITGGTIIQSFSSPFNSGFQIDFIDQDVSIYPGDTLTFALTLSGTGGTTDTNVSVNWIENT
jgi:hypothetical protein